MQEREDKKLNSIIGLIMRKCGVSKLIIDDKEIVDAMINPRNEVLQLYDIENKCLRLILKEE